MNRATRILRPEEPWSESFEIARTMKWRAEQERDDKVERFDYDKLPDRILGYEKGLLYSLV